MTAPYLMGRSGFRGESFGDTARRLGSAGGVTVSADASDDEIMVALAQAASVSANIYSSDVANTLVAFGDSITANCNQIGSTSVIGSNSMSWIESANAQAGSPMVLLANLGVSGNTTTQMLARVSTVVAYSPRFCLVLGGQNDSLSSTGTVTTSYNNLVSIYQALMAAGIYVIAVSVLPDSQGVTDQSKAKLRLNALLLQYWRGRRGGEFVDLYRTVNDPLQPGGNAIGSPDFALADGIHPSVNGAWKMGTALAPVFTRLSSGLAYPLVSSQLDNLRDNVLSRNVCNNPLFSGTGGTVGTSITGTVADRWTTSIASGATAVASLVDEPSGYGKMQRMAVTAASGASTCELAMSNLAAFETFTAGNSYMISAAVNITSPVNLSCLRAKLVVGGASVAVFEYASGYDNGRLQTTKSGLVYVSMPLTLPAGTYSSAGLYFTSYFGAAGSVTFDVSRVSVSKLN